MGRSKMKQLAKLKSLLSFKNQSIVAGVVVSLVVLFVGYGLIKNIKTDKQSASAEQVSGSPESGVKSRISELYDTLKAKNLGSDTDMTGLDTLTDDWGVKWNRIKSAALKSQPGGGAGGAVSVAGAVKSVQRGTAFINVNEYSNEWQYISSKYSWKKVAISTVNPSKTVVSVRGQCASENKDTSYNAYGFTYQPYVAEITDSRIRFACETNGLSERRFHTFSWEAVEYY